MGTKGNGGIQAGETQQARVGRGSHCFYGTAGFPPAPSGRQTLPAFTGTWSQVVVRWALTRRGATRVHFWRKSVQDVLSLTEAVKLGLWVALFPWAEWQVPLAIVERKAIKGS